MDKISIEPPVAFAHFSEALNHHYFVVLSGMLNRQTMTIIAKNLSHLPSHKIREIEKITRRIIDTGMAEIVVLFGSFARGDYREERGESRVKRSDYDLLVVTDGKKEAIEEALRDGFSDISVSVQLVVEDIFFVNGNLAEGQFFFSDIKREGKLLYTSGRYELADRQEMSATRRREMAEEDFRRWHGYAGTFFEGAAFFVSRKAFGVAAFNYQQVAELSYKAVEMVFTHYQPHEHDLGLLRRRAGRLDRRTLDAFSCETDTQQELFDHLNYAYIGGRYQSEEEYPVTEEQLDYWAVETKRLLDITKTVCLERIAVLKNIESTA